MAQRRDVLGRFLPKDPEKAAKQRQDAQRVKREKQERRRRRQRQRGPGAGGIQSLRIPELSWLEAYRMGFAGQSTFTIASFEVVHNDAGTIKGKRRFKDPLMTKLAPFIRQPTAEANAILRQLSYVKWQMGVEVAFTYKSGMQVVIKGLSYARERGKPITSKARAKSRERPVKAGGMLLPQGGDPYGEAIPVRSYGTAYEEALVQALAQSMESPVEVKIQRIFLVVWHGDVPQDAASVMGLAKYGYRRAAASPRRSQAEKGRYAKQIRIIHQRYGLG